MFIMATIYVEDGDILSIVNNTGGHPFRIKRTLDGSNYNWCNKQWCWSNGSHGIQYSKLGGKHIILLLYCTNIQMQ